MSGGVNFYGVDPIVHIDKKNTNLQRSLCVDRKLIKLGDHYKYIPNV